MAKDPSLLTSATPTAIAPTRVSIGHVQLRDLIICPRERGIVSYVQQQSIVEQNISTPHAPPRTLAKLSFCPNTLASLSISGTNLTLLAAGGQDADLYLSLHSSHPSLHRQGIPAPLYEDRLHGSINNSVFLTSLSLTRSNESSAEPRVGISNNDKTVKFFDVPIRGHGRKGDIKEAGILRLDVPVNHSSLSPDGRTLLSVGDSSKVYLHRITGGSRITFSEIATLSVPPPDLHPVIYPTSSLAASFSTSFSMDGMKFAVASQEGIVAVWDIRSTKVLKVFHTDKTRPSGGGNGSATSWLSDDPLDWTRGSSKAPGWSVRNVKFGAGGHSGKEIMTFTEHTSLLHIVDARTFETEEIVKVPKLTAGSPSPPQRLNIPPQTRPQVPRHLSSFTPAITRFNSISPPRSAGSSSPRRGASQSQYRPLVFQALEDTFRIPPSTSSSHLIPPPIQGSHWRTFSLRRTTSDPEDELLIIPQLGDHEVETGVQALLEGHGMRRSADLGGEDGDTNTGSAHADYEYSPGGHSSDLNPYGRAGRRTAGDEEMEVDELESDCVSSAAPSRSSSPSPQTHVGSRNSPTPGGRTGTPGGLGWWDHASREEVGYAERWDRSPKEEMVYADDLDLAGLCFDPTGSYVYVASTAGVAEWSVRGAEKRWWFEKGWA